jgi:hypothetical protein
VHSTQRTRQASRRQGGATRPARGPDAARAPHNCTRELALHRAPARGRRPWDRAPHPTPPQPPRAQSRAL